MNHQTEAEAVASLIQRPGHGLHETSSEGGAVRPFYLGQDAEGQLIVKDLSALWEQKPWKEGNAQMSQLDSLRSYLKEQGDSGTAIFVECGVGRLAIKAIMDFHVAGGGYVGGMHHRASFHAALSTPFEALMGRASRTMDQRQFLDLVEEVAPLIVEPDAAELLEMLSDLEAKETTSYRSVIHRGGGIKVTGEDETQVVNQVLPAEVVFQGRPFCNTGENNPLLTLKARVRVRIQAKALSFSLHYEQMREAWDAVGSAMIAQEGWERVFFGGYED